MSLYCGIDLYSNKHVVTIIDENDKILFERRLPNKLETTFQFLSAYRDHIIGIAVASNYNWYWLVDGLMDAGYALRLVHTSATKQYEV